MNGSIFLNSELSIVDPLSAGIFLKLQVGREELEHRLCHPPNKHVLLFSTTT